MTVEEAGFSGTLQAPSLRRRLACMLYEVLILFGVGLIPGALGTVLLKWVGPANNQDKAILLQFIGFTVYGLYFVWFWVRRGQTLPMQTWHIKLVTAQGGPVGVGRAMARYAACAVWLLPAVALSRLNHWAPTTELMAVGLGIGGYAALALLHPQRQFWHDVLCGTRQISVHAPRHAAA